jgi:predicted RNase H-like HicB family nuclease
MKKEIYFAVFEPTNTGYSLYFPDLPGCISVGCDIKESIEMAKETLGLHLWGMKKDNLEIPMPTNPPFLDLDHDNFIIPIEVYPDMIKNEMENKSVKKTLTIPSWLNDIAEDKGVNFSQILQEGLKDYLHVQ